jgi:hypothetical protein
MQVQQNEHLERRTCVPSGKQNPQKNSDFGPKKASFEPFSAQNTAKLHCRAARLASNSRLRNDTSVPILNPRESELRNSHSGLDRSGT